MAANSYAAGIFTQTPPKAAFKFFKFHFSRQMDPSVCREKTQTLFWVLARFARN
jgi:hypothetical protein